MEEKQDGDKNIDDVMMPGFRFHPTDEELVGFYLRRKIQQRTLPIELIKQVDIYKYDPWDLPKLSSTGEKEWYFYCPRDRKYRNSSRPNRVTGAGFWKATGTDRPIYSSDGTKCIGLKKSLVFYRGRAAKGMKTDWMMHEFRLPSLSEPSPPPPKKILDRGLPANEAWAICRIFKKTNSMAQRAQLSHSWNMHPFPETQFSPDLENISCTTEIGSSFRIYSNNDLPPPPPQQQQQQPSSPSFPALDIPPYKPYLSPTSSNGDLHNNFIFSNTDPSSMVMTHHAVPYEGQHYGFSINFPQEMQSNLGSGQHQQQEEETGLRKNPSEIPDCNNNNWGPMRSIGFPFSLAPNQSNPPWDSSTSPSVMSTTYSTNKCYT